MNFSDKNISISNTSFRGTPEMTVLDVLSNQNNAKRSHSLNVKYFPILCENHERLVVI